MDIEELRTKANNMNNWEIKVTMQSMSVEDKEVLLNNKALLEDEFKLQKYDLADVIKTLDDDNLKIDYVSKYELPEYIEQDIVKTFSDERKKQIIFDGTKNYRYGEIISSLSNKEIVSFIQEHQDILKERNIPLRGIIRTIAPEERRVKFCENELRDLQISNEEKKLIYASLYARTKELMDIKKVPEEYREAFNLRVIEDIKMPMSTLGMIMPNLDEDFSKYIGLEELLYINPTHMSEKDRQKVSELLKVCPKAEITDDIGLTRSTAKEYIDSEKWIERVLEGINPEWKDIQKIAYIDNAVGKRITYTPTFDTEVCNLADARTLWRIIDKGQGVCNGITIVEQYILDRAGIKSEYTSSQKHAFLRVKDIDIPTDDGVKHGDSILDPTWNLTAQKYGALPANFLVSYEQIRKNDIRGDGEDHLSHKNDEALSDVRLNLDEQYLRAIYKSIGIARNDGSFPIKDLMDNAKDISKEDLSEVEKIEKEFELIKEYKPDFANSINDTMKIIKDVVLYNSNCNNSVVHRVYDKNDLQKNPILYIFLDLPEEGRKFYIANRQLGEFINIEEQEFNERFECYEMDMEKFKGRPWQIGLTDIEEDINKSSGDIIAEKSSEGVDRDE